MSRFSQSYITDAVRDYSTSKGRGSRIIVHNAVSTDIAKLLQPRENDILVTQDGTDVTIHEINTEERFATKVIVTSLPEHLVEPLLTASNRHNVIRRLEDVLHVLELDPKDVTHVGHIRRIDANKYYARTDIGAGYARNKLNEHNITNVEVADSKTEGILAFYILRKPVTVPSFSEGLVPASYIDLANQNMYNALS